MESVSQLNAHFLNVVTPKEIYPKAKAAAPKALAIDATLSEAHTSLAYVMDIYDWDWSGAEKEFQRAIELNPNNALAHYRHGIALQRVGSVEEAIAEEKRALELDPLSLTSNRMLGSTMYHAKQYDQAIEQLRKTLDLDPHFRLAVDDLGLVYLQKSMYNEGIAQFQFALQDSPTNTATLSYLGYAYALGGRRVEAQRILDQLTELSKQKYVPTRLRAKIYAALGQKDEAFEWLEKSFEDRSIGTALSSPKVDPTLDLLRSDPRFQDLLRRMNLQP